MAHGLAYGGVEDVTYIGYAYCEHSGNLYPVQTTYKNKRDARNAVYDYVHEHMLDAADYVELFPVSRMEEAREAYELAVGDLRPYSDPVNVCEEILVRPRAAKREREELEAYRAELEWREEMAALEAYYSAEAEHEDARAAYVAAFRDESASCYSAMEDALNYVNSANATASGVLKALKACGYRRAAYSNGGNVWCNSSRGDEDTMLADLGFRWSAKRGQWYRKTDSAGFAEAVSRKDCSFDALAGWGDSLTAKN